MLICPRCGATSDNMEFSGPFCLGCARERIAITTPGKIEIERCKRCTRYKIRGEWTKNTRNLEDWVINKCKGNFARAIFDYETQTAAFFTMIHGKQHRTDRSIPVDIMTVMCSDCSRLSGGYFQAIVQLRGNKLKVQKNFDKLKEIFGPKITKIEELKEGLNLYTTNSKETMQILHRQGLKYGIAKQLAGVSEGKKFYRVSFAVRFD